jgi:SnoaL-like domain
MTKYPTPTAPPVSLHGELLAVVTALWFEIDHGDGSGASAFFTPDAELRFIDRSFVGTAEIDAVYRARTERGRRVSRHLVTNLHVTQADEASASVISALILFADDGEPPRPTVAPVMIGDVVDEFVRTGDRWLISSRHVREVFRAPDSVLAVPTHSGEVRAS